MKNYLFASERLGFRNWVEEDFPTMASISGNPEVMEFFPAVATELQTIDFLKRMQQMCIDKGYCYFAVDELESSRLIGFIGLCDQTYESSFTPAVDIGWRLSPEFWGKGYATEGAKRCLDYGFRVIGLDRIISTAPSVNVRSVHVMEKIGMKLMGSFDHPRLAEHPHLNPCVWFRSEKDS